ncbi:MAG: hypothetical protein AAF414_11300 [Pseudomonadota bacterium]
MTYRPSKTGPILMAVGVVLFAAGIIAIVVNWANRPDSLLEGVGAYTSYGRWYLIGGIGAAVGFLLWGIGIVLRAVDRVGAQVNELKKAIERVDR